MQDGETPKDVPFPQPCLWVVPSSTILGRINEVELVIEKEKIATIPAKKALLVLLSTFYAFNMEYTEGCSNFYTALEIIFFHSKRDPSKIKVNRLLAALGV